MTDTTVMCTWCEAVCDEEELEVRLDTEHCPQCRVSGWLMDVAVTQ
jgi:hypothetical protein